MSIDHKQIAIRYNIERSLYEYARYAFKMQKGALWRRNWHHELICQKLEAVYRGEIKRLIINMPPRYSKTELAVVDFISWCLALNPDCEFIYTSFSATLAANYSAITRDIVGSDWYQGMFVTRLQADASAKHHWKTAQGGVVYSSGAAGTITGFGAGKMREGFGGALIIDDPHKPDEVTSDVMRQNVIDWFQNTIQSRLNSRDTPIILIMQRLHEDDLSGFLLNGGTGEHWEHLCLPAINDSGEALWSEKHDIDELRRMESKNAYTFAGQYMQRPAPLGGGIIKDAWWKYYRPEALPPVKRYIHSWDTAFKAKDHNDPSSGQVWAECENGFYLIDRINRRMEYPELKRAVMQLHDKHRANTILVEDKASGQSLIQDLRQTTLPVVPIKVDTDKVTRAFAVTGLIESGRVFLPEYTDWVSDFIGQMSQFPNGKHDDDVDAMTQALNYLNTRQPESGFGKVIF